MRGVDPLRPQRAQSRFTDRVLRQPRDVAAGHTEVREARGDIYARRRLANAAFLIGHRDDARHVSL